MVPWNNLRSDKFKLCLSVLKALYLIVLSKVSETATLLYKGTSVQETLDERALQTWLSSGD